MKDCCPQRFPGLWPRNKASTSLFQITAPLRTKALKWRALRVWGISYCTCYWIKKTSVAGGCMFGSRSSACPWASKEHNGLLRACLTLSARGYFHQVQAAVICSHQASFHSAASFHCSQALMAITESAAVSVDVSQEVLEWICRHFRWFDWRWSSRGSGFATLSAKHSTLAR